MRNPSVEIIRRLCRPLEPLPADRTPRLGTLPGVRAVLFDVYGTLFVSGREPGPEVGAPAGEAFRAALASVGLDGPMDGAVGVAVFHDVLRRRRERLQDQGVPWPEVVIEDVWRETLDELGRRGQVVAAPGALDVRRIALEFECRVNPVWPMPGAVECLGALRRAGFVLGVVSNSQFYTRELFPALLGQTPEELGFPASLQLYSYRLGRAKPDLSPFRRALEALRGMGIGPAETLHLGNDRRQDVWPAARLGLHTALFAGDARGLRWRGEDPDLVGIVPDLEVTELVQLPPCLTAGGREVDR